MNYATTREDVQRMFGSIAPRYDLANSVLSFGVHHFWRRALLGLVKWDLPTRADGSVAVCDLCTGTGDLLPLLKRRFGRAIGVDFCLPMLQAGKSAALKQFSLIQGDGLKLPFANNSLSLVTVAFGVRNFESLSTGLEEIRRVLLPGGTLLVLEFGQPYWKPFGLIFQWYSKYLMPIIGGILTGDGAAYRYLPETASRFPCGKSFEKILRDSGYGEVRSAALTFGIAYRYVARKA